MCSGRVRGHTVRLGQLNHHLRLPLLHQFLPRLLIASLLMQLDSVQHKLRLFLNILALVPLSLRVAVCYFCTPTVPPPP